MFKWNKKFLFRYIFTAPCSLRIDICINLQNFNLIKAFTDWFKRQWRVLQIDRHNTLSY